MFNVVFSKSAKEDVQKLPKDTQKRILKKIQFFSQLNNVIAFSKPLVDLPPATHRFRVGDYRIAFALDKNVIFILSIKHRKEIYR